MIRRTAILAVAAAAIAFSQTPDEVRKAEAAWADAIKKADAAAIGQLLADNMIYTHSSALVESKAEYIAKLKSKEQVYKTTDYSDMKVTMYGNTAILTATVHMTGTTKDVPFDNTVRVLHVWVKQGGRWQMVAHQTTKIP